jgi:hypothetical protein
MRSLQLAWALPLLVASLAAGGCAAPAEESEGETEEAVTGGTGSIESPVAFLFEAAATAEAGPKCAGAMLSDTMVVTAKGCAKAGLVVGRAADKDGRGERAKVKTVHVPEGAEADIAVVELDKPLKGAYAVITHMPLRSGYAVNAFAAKKGGLFSPDKNEASTVSGTMTDETETHGSITPAKGSEICDGDTGAPVCSSTGGKIFGYNLFGTCGLSGLVVSRIASETPAKAPAAGTPAPDADAAKCSGGAWKVAQLGQHRAFLSKLAPKAFQPLRIDKPIIRNYAFVPEGLWGYKTKGDVKACTLDATKLDAVKPGAPSAKLTAKVSFAGMDKKAAAWGRFGIAPKSAPTKMRWLPAEKMDSAKGAAFESKFQGVASAEVAGDYVVAFRASANGGETWTTCDTDGIENGYSAEKSLSLSVSDGTTPPAPGTPPPGNATPASEPPTQEPVAEGETISDGDENGNSDELPDFEPKKKGDKASDSGGCSMTSAPAPLSSSLPIVGVLLGLVAVARRRRQS